MESWGNSPGISTRERDKYNIYSKQKYRLSENPPSFEFQITAEGDCTISFQFKSIAYRRIIIYWGDGQNSIVNFYNTDLTNISHDYIGENIYNGYVTDDLSSITYLNCELNSYISSLKINALINLLDLYCCSNIIGALDLSELPNLINLECYNNRLTALYINQLSNLEYLQTVNNNLTSEMVSNIIIILDSVGKINGYLKMCDQSPLVESISDEATIAATNLTNKGWFQKNVGTCGK